MTAENIHGDAHRARHEARLSQDRTLASGRADGV